MSWDISLECNCCGNEIVDENYTHNTNKAVNTVMDENSMPIIIHDGSWWKHLHNLPGPDGAAFLDALIRGLEQDMPRFRKMNPENGWGDIDQLVDIMRQMRDDVPEFPTTWRAHG